MDRALAGIDRAASFPSLSSLAYRPLTGRHIISSPRIAAFPRQSRCSLPLTIEPTTIHGMVDQCHQPTPAQDIAERDCQEVA